MKKPSQFHGLLVLDKPGGLTSRAAVTRAQGWFPRGTRIGHTGTLDPLATGVLVLCVGLATRFAEYVQRMGKTYRAGLLLGARSDTDDADGTVTPTPGVQPSSPERIAEGLREFVGEIEQIPPSYSAAKVTGRRAYDLARRGQEVLLAPRRVQIYGIDILHLNYPQLELEVRCGKGTYIRSLARDLGERLGCGALVQTLRRTQVGPMSVENALTLEGDASTARTRLLGVAAAVADLPRLVLGAEEVRRLRCGQAVPWTTQGDAETMEFAVFDERGELVAVAERDGERGPLRPVKVLAALNP